MKEFYERISTLVNNDHNYMTLAACKQLPEMMQQQIKPEAGLLIRYFCELPDCGWPIYGTLGAWEINNHFAYDIRRDYNVSFYLGWNPVARTGKRFGHDTAGTRNAAPILLRKAVEAMTEGRLRDGLAYGGAACHHIQDAVTYPEQQTLHRRAMGDVLTFDIEDYEPEIIFSSVAVIPDVVDDLLDERIAKALQGFSKEIRKSMISGHARLRHETQQQSDMLGAEITADILCSLLQFYVPKADSPVNHLELFNKTDEEHLPIGYFIDREDSPVFQGYAEVEGEFPRAFELRLTPGLQLRLSATGSSEVRWKQGIASCVPVTSMTQYCFKAMAYTKDAAGSNGIRLLFYNDCIEVTDSIEMPVEKINGWVTINKDITTNASTKFMSIELYSRNNSGTILLDHWQIYDATVQPELPESPIKDKLKLALAPGTGCHLTDMSNFAIQNEPITCVRDNLPSNITDGNEFVFDGCSFIEIPYHPLYQPLQIAGTFALSFEFCASEIQQGEIFMAANLHSPPVSGWRLFLQTGKLSVAVYNKDKKYILMCHEIELTMNQWHKVKLELSPENHIAVTVDGTCTTATASFARCYSQSDIFIGADAGAQNFLAGRLKNLRIKEI